MSSFKKYFFFSLIFAAINVAVLLVFFVPRFNHSDTPQYIATVNYVLGKDDGELHLNRLLYPAPVLISAVLNPIFSPANAFIFQNIIFYFLSIILVFLLVLRFYKNEKQAFYASALFAASYPVLAYGLAILTDMPGWFFYLFSVLLSLNFYRNPGNKTALLAGIITGLGMLFKESVAAGAIFFTVLVFLAMQFSLKEKMELPRPRRDGVSPTGQVLSAASSLPTEWRSILPPKIKYVFLFGVAFSVPILINSIIFYKTYSYSYLERYIDVVHDKTGGIYAYSPLRMIIEVGRVFALGWLFFLFGALKEISLKNKERWKFLLALILPSISFLFWAFPHNRIAFVAFPLLVLLASFGLSSSGKLSDFSKAGLLIIYVLFNYLTLEFLLQWGPVLQYRF